MYAIISMMWVATVQNDVMCGCLFSEAVQRIPPSRPTVTKKSDSSVLVEWSMPVNNDSLPVVLFKVQYQQLKPRRRWKTTDDEISPTARQFEVHDLKPGLSVASSGPHR